MSKHRKKNANTSILVTGFSIFALFFGAGNLIFPPKLGSIVGVDWLVGTIGFLITDIGLSLVAMISIMRGGGYIERVINSISPLLSKIVVTIIFLFIGPIVVIPRILALINEVGVLPLFPGANDLVISSIFLILIGLVVFDPRNIVGIIGKYLTPILIIGLLIFIGVGLHKHIGNEINLPVENALGFGMIQGYQTLDIMGAVIFAKIFSENFRRNKIRSSKTQTLIVIKSSSIAILLMMIVYGGLAWLGALSQTHFDPSTDNVVLLKGIIQLSMGNIGFWFLSAIVITACFTTVVGLVSTSAEYFHDLFNKKIGYKVMVFLVLLTSLLISKLGVQKILDYSVPVINYFYPAIIIIFLTHLSHRIFWKRIPILVSIFTSLIFGIPQFLDYFGYLPIEWDQALHHIPFYDIGLSWFIPSTITGFIAYLFIRHRTKKATL